MFNFKVGPSLLNSVTKEWDNYAGVMEYTVPQGLGGEGLISSQKQVQMTCLRSFEISVVDSSKGNDIIN